MRVKKRFVWVKGRPRTPVWKVYRFSNRKPRFARLLMVAALVTPSMMGLASAGIIYAVTKPAKIALPPPKEAPAPIVHKRQRWEPPQYLMPRQDMPE